MIGRLERQIEKEERDLTVLAAVIENEPIGIVRLSDETDVPEHKVRYSLRMLENDGYIEPTPQGATTPDDIGERVAEINEGLDALAERVDAIDLPDT